MPSDNDLFGNLKNLILLMDYFDCFIVSGRDFSKIGYANEACIKILQLNKSNYIGQCLRAYCQEKNYSLIKLLDVNPVDSLEEGYQVDECQTIVSWKKISLPSSNFEKSDFLLVGKDITKESQLNERLQATEFFYENILSHLPTNVYWKDKNSVYLGCNERLARIMGLPSRHAIKGMTDYDFEWGEIAAKKFIDFDKKVMETGLSLTTEDVFKEASGKEVTVLTNKTPLKDKHGNTGGVLAISVDITDRKKMEEELRQSKIAAESANLAKSEFIANMSHDIRTPLTGVIGMATILEDSAQDEETKQTARYLEQSGNQLLAMLNEILDVVTHEHINEMLLEEEPFSLHKMIQNIIELERPSALIKRLGFTSEIDDGIPPCLIGDKTKLHRIILNLVGNALKFTQEGSVTIKLNCLKKTRNELTLQVCVIDTGIGIAPEFQGKVFEKFTRATPSYKGTYKGHGLGMHIAFIYAQALGGLIRFTSEVGKGTTFFVEVPLKIGKVTDLPKTEKQIVLKSHADSPIPTKHKQTEKTKSAVTDISPDAPHLLLIEDSQLALLTLETTVRKAGFRYTSVGDGEGAFELATKQDFDLIISDIGLPGISGIEFVEQLRAYEKLHQKGPVPVIGLTAHASGEIVEDCLKAGMNEALAKPIRQDHIEHIKETYLKTNKDTVKAAKLGIDLPDTEEELFVLEQFPLLDISYALRATGDDPETLKMILTMMLDTQMSADQAEIEEAYSRQDWDAVEKIAHRMKGGFLCCGTQRLVYASQYLERYHKAGHSKELERLYQQLLFVIQETIPVIQDWIDNN